MQRCLRRGLDAFAQFDGGDGHFAQPRIGETDHAGILDRRIVAQHLGDRLGRDFEQPPRMMTLSVRPFEEDEAVFVDQREIGGPHPIGRDAGARTSRRPELAGRLQVTCIRLGLPATRCRDARQADAAELHVTEVAVFGDRPVGDHAQNSVAP